MTVSTSITIPLIGSVGKGGLNRSDDVLAVKNRLRDLGFDWVSTDDKVDQGLIKAIELFQSIAHGLNRVKGDGRIDVNQFTHRWLEAANAPHWQLMPASGVGFVNEELKDINDHHDYGTNWLAEAIVEAGKIYQANYRNANPCAALIAVNDASLPIGGDTPDHAGHETGLACDLRLPRLNGSTGGIRYTDARFDRKATEAMLKALKQNSSIRVIFFNDPTLIAKGLCVRASGHDDHIHFEVAPH